MNNEEKAREIANEYCYWDDRDESGAVKVAIEMAEWKDQQFKERMEKKISHLEDSRKNWNVQSNRYIAFGITIQNLKSIINELLE